MDLVWTDANPQSEVPTTTASHCTHKVLGGKTSREKLSRGMPPQTLPRGRSDEVCPRRSLMALRQFPARRPESDAVGTPVARRPPRRSQRARLTHWAPRLGSGV